MFLFQHCITGDCGPSAGPESVYFGMLTLSPWPALYKHSSRLEPSMRNNASLKAVGGMPGSASMLTDEMPASPLRTTV